MNEITIEALEDFFPSINVRIPQPAGNQILVLIVEMLRNNNLGLPTVRQYAQQNRPEMEVLDYEFFEGLEQHILTDTLLGMDCEEPEVVMKSGT